MRKSRLARNHIENNTPLRQARSCYKHLAGVAGVKLFERLKLHSLFTQNTFTERQSCILNKKGKEVFSFLNIDYSKSGRFAYACPDWTETGFHLGGLLGRNILSFLLYNRLVEQEEKRVIVLNPTYQLWIDEMFH